VGRFAGACSLASILASTASCFTFVSFDDGAGGAPAGTATSSTSTSTGAGGGATATSGNGGGHDLDCGGQTDAQNCGLPGNVCGPGSDCCGGVCSPVRHAAVGIVEIARTQNRVVTRAADELSLWATDLSQVVDTTNVDELGSGYLLGTQDHLFYRPQLAANCTGACIETFVVSADSLLCMGSHVWEGPAGHVNGAAVVDDKMYFVTSGEHQVYGGNLSCLTTPVGNCGAMPTTCAPSSVASDMRDAANASSVLPPSLLELDPGGDLWWTTFGTGGCVYHIPVPAAPSCTNCPAFCISLSTLSPGLLTASAAGIFVATNQTVDVTDGPVVQVDRNTETVSVVAAEARWPMDSDAELLFAAGPGPGGSATVLAINDQGETVARVEATDGSATITAIDASDPVFVYFATEGALYQWRKPLCTGPVRCGDGCLDRSAEQCDDGNLEPNDGCDALCQFE
jgi:cysteine-rich repeat protein